MSADSPTNYPDGSAMLDDGVYGDFRIENQRDGAGNLTGEAKVTFLIPNREYEQELGTYPIRKLSTRGNLTNIDQLPPTEQAQKIRNQRSGMGTGTNVNRGRGGK